MTCSHSFHGPAMGVKACWKCGIVRVPVVIETDCYSVPTVGAGSIEYGGKAGWVEVQGRVVPE